MAVSAGAGNVPVGEVPVETGRSVEHALQGGGGADVPAGEVAVEGGYSARGETPVEHDVHAGDMADIPHRDVAVEAGCLHERAMHIGDRGDVPAGDVLVEVLLVPEHAIQAGDPGDVPVTDAGGRAVAGCLAGVDRSRELTRARAHTTAAGGRRTTAQDELERARKRDVEQEEQDSKLVFSGWLSAGGMANWEE